MNLSFLSSNRKYLILYLTVYLFYSINLFILFKSSNSIDNIKCYLLNYDGGFVRRGLFGEIIKIFSNYISLENIFFILYFFIYTIFFYYFFKLTQGFKKNICFYFFIFSPLNFLYPLIQLDYNLPVFLGNFEIFIITFYIYFSFLLNTNINKKKYYWIGILGLIFLSFLYEMTIFTYPFFIFIYYLFLKKNLLSVKFAEIVIFNLIFSLILFIHFYFNEGYNFSIFFENIYSNYNINININKECTYSWMNRKILDQITPFYEDFKISYIFKYLIYSHPILILFVYTIKNNNDKIINYLFTFSLIFISILFVIAVDWARLIHIIYLFSIITVLSIYKYDNNFFLNMHKKFSLEKFNKNYLSIFVFLYCTMWSLKHTYWQNHLSYASVVVIKQSIKSLFSFF